MVVRAGALAAVAALTATAALASVPPAYRAHLPLETRAGDIAFMSGGKDQDEELSLKRAAQDYPLELVFEEKDRPYDWIAGVPVRIRDEQGRIVLQDMSGGPIFLARLPRGRYTVEVKWDAWTFSRQVELGDGRERVVFSWRRDVAEQSSG